MVSRLRRPVPAILAALVFGGLAGCEEKNAYVPPPPPEVSVLRPVQKTITTYKEYTGVAQGVEQVDLRARVKGFLKHVKFEAGDDVKKGQVLFEIDDASFRAAVDVAKADLANKKALLAAAEAEYRRSVPLYEKNVYAELDLIKLRANRNAAEAAVEAAEASLRSAELDLSYTKVVAPISGQISREQVDVGNLVGNNEATLLATIVKYNPVEAYFTLSESDMLAFAKMRRQGQRPDYRKEKIPMGMGLGDESGFPHEGYLDYTDPRLDAATGTLQARGVFPNPDRMIVPGSFVRLRIPYEVSREVLMVPERALGSDLAGRYVLVVDDEGKVQQKTVTTGSQQHGLVVVEKGVKPGDRVVVNGLQRARPGAEVKPVEITDPTEFAGTKPKTDPVVESEAKTKGKAVKTSARVGPRVSR
jgi:membrane fusion protein (multidrug efflux system)